MIIAVWLAASCTGGAAQPDSMAPVQASTTVSAVPVEEFGRADVDPAEITDTDATIWRSPIEETLGFEADPTRLSEAYREAADERQIAIDGCMAAEGYDEYRHDPPEALPSPAVLLTATPSHDLARYGYGPIAVIRSRFEQLRGATSEPDGPPAIAVYLAERPYLDEDALNTTLNDCVDRAWDEFPPPQRSFPEALAAEIAELREAVYQSSAVREAWTAWSACMADEGYDVRDRSDARRLAEANGAELFEQLNQWAAQNHEPAPPEIDAFRDELEVVVAEEQKLADTDLACAAQSEVEPILYSELWAAEQAWMEENRERVELVLSETGGS